MAERKAKDEQNEAIEVPNSHNPTDKVSKGMAARRQSGDDNPFDKALGPAMTDLQPGDARLAGKDNPSQFGVIRGHRLIDNKPEA